MPKFTITASEIIFYEVDIEAESKEKALDLALLAAHLWDHGKIMGNEIEDLHCSEIKE